MDLSTPPHLDFYLSSSKNMRTPIIITNLAQWRTLTCPSSKSLSEYKTYNFQVKLTIRGQKHKYYQVKSKLNRWILETYKLITKKNKSKQYFTLNP